MISMTNEVVWFVGYYTTFSFENDPEHWVKLFERVISLEGAHKFRWAKYMFEESLKEKSVNLDEHGMDEILKQFSSGKLTMIEAQTATRRTDWKEALAHGVTFEGHARFVEPRGGRGPIMSRFGKGGNVMITFPLERFEKGKPTDFQNTLVDAAKKLFKEFDCNWSFIHLGAHEVRPFSVGQDDLFMRTRDRFPITAFDYDIRMMTDSYYKEFAKGAFWANFLNRRHVASLGGMDAIMKARPCSVIEDLGDNKAYLQVGPSPAVPTLEGAADEYQRLRRFLKPVLLETSEDVYKLECSIEGKEKVDRIVEQARNDPELSKILREDPEPDDE
jgi:hypothetical protein